MKYFNNLQSFYSSEEWTLFRRTTINERMNESGELICDYCKKPIFKKYDIIAHHIEELTLKNVNNINISLNPDNIQLVHHACHNKIHNRFQGGYVYKARKVYLITGSPLAGKNTWVLNNANSEDLIVDIDKIWECISINNKYCRSDKLKDNMFSVRNELLDQVKTRKGNWTNAYVVMSLPIKAERDRYINTLGAEHILIDTDKEECMRRLKNNKDGRSIKEWTQYIEDYWNKLQI